MEFKKVRDAYTARKRLYKDADLVPEVKKLKAKFEKYQMEQVEKFTYQLFKDYIAFTSEGILIKAQRAKIVEALIKWGKDSLYFKMVDETRMLRRAQWIRVVQVVRLISKYVKEGFPKTIRGIALRRLTLFLKMSVSIRKYLLVVPLTEPQMIQLWHCEKALGIYYTDLTPEENGEIWRMKALKEIEEKND